MYSIPRNARGVDTDLNWGGGGGGVAEVDMQVYQ